MAAGKFATKLHRNSHKIVVVLVYAVLEWVLIMLLLFNSLFYYFIKRFANFFGLKPPCLLCSSVAQLFEPPRKDEDLFCEAHTVRFPNTLEEIENRCQQCSFKSLLEVAPKEEKDNSEIHEEEPQILSDVGSFYPQEAAEEDEDTGGVEIEYASNEKYCDESADADENDLRDKELMEWNWYAVGDGNTLPVDEEKDCVEFEKKDIGGTEASVSCKSDVDEQDLKSGCDENPVDCSQVTENEAPDNHPGGKKNRDENSYPNCPKSENQQAFHTEEYIVDHSSDPGVAVEQLRSELETERKARRDLLAELEAERNAAAIAANQTMAMINRLQEEKAAIKTEAVQYQRMMEEQAEYDQEALQLLNELVIKREKEKQELEKDVEMYKDRMFDYEVKSLCDDSEKLSIDLNREVGEDEGIEVNSTGVVLNSVDMVLHRVKNWNMLDGSLEEFEQERVSILSQLKELEEKLFSVCDEDDDEYDDVRPIEHFLEENAHLCSPEVNLCPVEKCQPATMAAAAKKLLPFLEEDGDHAEKVELDEKKIECNQKVETEDNVVAVMKEMDHVYGRLHALEADREFLRHCISSLSKGDKGIDLLGEILQHLRDLRNVEPSELMICNE